MRDGAGGLGLRLLPLLFALGLLGGPLLGLGLLLVLLAAADLLLELLLGGGALLFRELLDLLLALLLRTLGLPFLIGDLVLLLLLGRFLLAGDLGMPRLRLGIIVDVLHDLSHMMTSMERVILNIRIKAMADRSAPGENAGWMAGHCFQSGDPENLYGLRSGPPPAGRGGSEEKMFLRVSGLSEISPS